MTVSLNVHKHEAGHHNIGPLLLMHRSVLAPQVSSATPQLHPHSESFTKGFKCFQPVARYSYMIQARQLSVVSTNDSFCGAHTDNERNVVTQKNIITAGKTVAEIYLL